MLVNLPEDFPKEKLNNFSFGNVDAKRDNALSSLMFISCNNVLQKFKTGRYSIIVGEKGAGKTAIFTLFKKNVISFDNTQYKIESIFIEAGFDLSLYNQLITQYVRSHKAGKENLQFKYQIIWELFFTFNILKKLNDLQLLSSQLNSAYKSFTVAFSKEHSYNIIDFIRSLKLKIGVSASTLNPGEINAYTEISPVDHVDKEKRTLDLLKFNLSEYKKEIIEILKSNNICLGILIDKLDDFVTKENYNYQKLFLQSLLFVEDSFFDSEFLKVYIFLRKDLYDRLDKTSLGPDKIESRKLEIIWSKKEILDFLSRRILFLYNYLFGMTKFDFKIDDRNLYLDEKNLSNQFDIGITNKNLFFYLKKIIPDFIKNKLISSYQKIPKRSRYLNEQLSEDIIYSIFPKKVYHQTMEGSKEFLNFEDFLITHTALANGKTNPRMVLLFCNVLFEEVSNYYLNNPDLNIHFEDGRYKLIPEELFLEAYKKFQNNIFEIFRQYDFKKNDFFIKLAKAISKKKTVKESELLKKLKVNTQSKSETEEFNRDLAFFCSSGVLGTESYIRDHSDRIYRVPIVFREPIK